MQTLNTNTKQILDKVSSAIETHEELVGKAFAAYELRRGRKTRDYLVKDDTLNALRALSTEALVKIIEKKFYVLMVASGLTRSRLVNILSEYCIDIKCIGEEGDLISFSVPVQYLINWRTICAVEKIRFVSFQ